MSENTPTAAVETAAPEAAATSDPATFVSDPVLSPSPTAEARAHEAHAAHPAAHSPAHAPAPAHAAAHVAHSTPAAPAVHAGISVDERAYEQYQALAKAVLESAEIASRSAEAAMAVSRELKQATGNFRDLSDAGYKKGRLLLAIGGGVMIVCLIFFLIMGVRMVSRINKLDVMM